MDLRGADMLIAEGRDRLIAATKEISRLSQEVGRVRDQAFVQGMLVGALLMAGTAAVLFNIYH